MLRNLRRNVIGLSRPITLAVTFALTLTIRIWDIDRHFWLLEDQIRDWSIALRPFSGLPLVGPPTHVHGYTIGPAFYWILWAIRLTVGPWFQNLPHAGGIGQAMLQSAADTLLLAAVWRRTNSVWLALTTIAVIATASIDLCLSALVWNPMAGSALAKIATALILLKWPAKSTGGVALTAAVAWCAVQSYTGAVFVAIGVFVALLADPAIQRDWGRALRVACIIAVVVAVLQLPYAFHQFSIQFVDSGMTAVTGSLTRVVTGQASPEFSTSWAGYNRAFNALVVSPLQLPWAIFVLLVCAGVVASRFRRDPTVISVTLLPQFAAVVGYAFYVGDFLDDYYYLSLMPAAVLTLVLSMTALRPPALARAVSIAVLMGVLLVVPARLRTAATLNRMPEYGALVDGSRELVHQGRAMRAIQTEFILPRTSDSQFIYEILGGHLDSASSWIGIIKSDGHVSYKEVGRL